MVIMHDSNNPKWRGDSVVHFYSGHVKIQNGLIEVDKPEWIETLLARGWRVGPYPSNVVSETGPVEIEDATPRTPTSRKTPPRRST